MQQGVHSCEEEGGKRTGEGGVEGKDMAGVYRCMWNKHGEEDRMKEVGVKGKVGRGQFDGKKGVET